MEFFPYLHLSVKRKIRNNFHNVTKEFNKFYNFPMVKLSLSQHQIQAIFDTILALYKSANSVKIFKKKGARRLQISAGPGIYLWDLVCFKNKVISIKRGS